MAPHQKTPSAGVIWISGLPGSGKTTLAQTIKSIASHAKVKILDGEDIRATLNSDCGYDAAGRKEHSRRVAHLARMFEDEEFLVVVALVSPYLQARMEARRVASRFTSVLLYASEPVILKRRPSYYRIPFEVGDHDFTFDTGDTSVTPEGAAKKILAERLRAAGSGFEV